MTSCTRIVPGTILATVVVFVAWTVADARRPIPRAVTIIVPSGSIRADIADTANTRAVGLSNRRNKDGHALLLTWSAPARHPIWMAGMRIPLDVVWLDQDGRVLALLTHVTPCVQQPCPLYEPLGTDRSVAVLECPAGGLALAGVHVGTQLRWRE